MNILYQISITIFKWALPLIQWVNPKLRLFYKGRKDTFTKIKNDLRTSDKTIWVHCASLGEFEQGRPVIEEIAKKYPTYKILLTFFSPSGYVVRKDYAYADCITYLPIDTKKQMKKWVQMTHPSLVIFVKYEFWPNVLLALKKQQIPTILISGIFRKSQLFFKKGFGFYSQPLRAFSHFFVQDDTSVALLKSIGFQNVSLSGDTRFDRVYKLSQQPKKWTFLDAFYSKSRVLIAGSTWEPDENILTTYINQNTQSNFKYIIAPHKLSPEKLKSLKSEIQVPSIFLSEIKTQVPDSIKVIIVDSIGLLNTLFPYAHVAYIGGGFGTGIHNILEPATYGIPILIGPKYDKFKEAHELIEKGACHPIQNSSEAHQLLDTWMQNPTETHEKGQIAQNYVYQNKGATDHIMAYIADTIY